MKVEKKENGLLNLVLDIKGDEFTVAKNNVLATLKDKKVDGFRPGKVPADVLEKTFAREIEEKLLNQFLSKEYTELLKNNEIKPVSQLLLDKVELKKDSLYAEFSLAVEPEFELPKYTGLNIEENEVTVTEEEVDNQLKSMVENAKKKVELGNDAVAELGHEAVINFEGFVEGVAFEGGKSENYPLVLGTKSFIDTFEDQIVGHKAGDEFEVNVKFPEEYHAENLKGKDAVFKVKLNKLSKFEKSELNDEFAKENGAENIEDLKNKIKDALLEQKKLAAKNEKLDKIFKELRENTNLEIVDIVVNEEVNNELNMLANQLQQSGLNIQQYFQMLGKTPEEVIEDMKPRAKENAKLRFILSKIAEVEKLTDVSEEELNAEFEKVASYYGQDVKTIKEELSKNNSLDRFEFDLKNRIINDKLMNFLYTNN